MLRRLAALLLALALPLSLTGCGAQNEASTMRLVRAEGTVQIHNEAGKAVEAAENLGLYSGYALATGAASYGWMTQSWPNWTRAAR